VSAEKFIAEARAEFLHQQGHSFDFKLKKWAESPIEQMVLAWLLTDGWVFPEQVVWSDACDCLRNHGADTSLILHRTDERFFIGFQAQMEIAAVRDRKALVRIDMVAIDMFERAPTKVAIELDGHDFHERTKTQAQRDKSRDRALTKLGWKVLRFTGSEVFAEPQRVAEELHELFVPPEEAT